MAQPHRHSDLEADLEMYFSRMVRSIGGIPIKLAPVTAGAPDRIALLPGGAGIHLVELKTTTGSLSPIQKVFHRRVAEIGIPIAVLHGREDVRCWIRNVLDDVYENDDES